MDFFKKVTNFFREIYTVNSIRSGCKVISFSHTDGEIGEVEVKFELSGVNLNLKLKASEIVSNAELLCRFPERDAQRIILFSGKCEYKIVEVTYCKNNIAMIAVEGRFNGIKLVKQFSAQEILQCKFIYERLLAGGKDLVNQIIKSEKVIPIFLAR